MAHVGKRWPLVPNPEFWMVSKDFHGGFYIPRCWQLRNQNTPSGSLALPWADDTFVSEPYEIAADRQEITWLIKHPDDPDSTVQVRLTWYLNNETEGGQFFANFHYKYHLAFIDHGTTWADGQWLDTGVFDQFRSNLSTTLIGFQIASGTGWPGFTTPATFKHMGNTKVACATWLQQEANYHPYRYGP